MSAEVAHTKKMSLLAGMMGIKKNLEWVACLTEKMVKIIIIFHLGFQRILSAANVIQTVVTE